MHLHRTHRRTLSHVCITRCKCIATFKGLKNMKYEIFNHYTDSIVGYAESLEEAQKIADIVDVQCQESDYDWIPWCEILEIPE